MAISPYQVLRSNAGYYVGRTEGGLPYDRRSGYFKTEIEAEQELCSYDGHYKLDGGICSKCSKVYSAMLVVQNMKMKPTRPEARKVLKKIPVKADLIHIAGFIGIQPESKARTAIEVAILDGIV